MTTQIQWETPTRPCYRDVEPGDRWRSPEDGSLWEAMTNAWIRVDHECLSSERNTWSGA